MNTMLAFGFHGGHGFAGLALIILALAIIAAIFLLTERDRGDGEKH